MRSGVFGGEGGQTGLGWDVAGTIDATDTATGWTVGDPVIALSPSIGKPLSTHAEYVIVDATAVAAAPALPDSAHASTLPLNALTAAQSLDLLDLRSGQTLLVTGAAGAVGSYTVQLAAHRGVKVTALAGEADEDLVRELGAARFIARGSAAVPHDAVVDAAAIGAAALEWARDEGAYVGVVPQANPAPVRGIRTTAVSVRPDGTQLGELVKLVDAGALTTRVAETYPLAEAAKAHARLAKGGIRGRLVLVP